MQALRSLLWPKAQRDDEAQGVELSGGCKAAELEVYEQRDARPSVAAVAAAAAAADASSEHQPLQQQPASSLAQQPHAQGRAGWALSASSTARLVLSVCLEVAEKQHRESLFAAGSWQAACEQCTRQELLRPLLQHYLPSSDLHLLQQQPQQGQQQPEPPERQQQAASHGTHELLGHLSLVVLLGEAVQLLTRPDRCAALQQLAAKEQQSQQATDHPLLGPLSVSSNSSSIQQRMQALIWPPLLCWLRQLHSLAAADAQPQGSHPSKLAWRQLALALVQLQQAQQASPPGVQQPLPLVVLLQQLEGLAVPALLQAADLAAPLNLEQQHPPEQQQLQLVLLLRLTRTTASLVAQHACNGAASSTSGTVEQHGPADGAAAELRRLLLQATRLLLAAAVPATTAAAVVASLCAAPGGSSGGVSSESPPAFVRPLLACSSKAAVPTVAVADAEAADAAGLSSPRTSWPAELLSSAQLWPAEDDGEDAEAITREERTLRAWINSLLHRGITGSTAASAQSPRAGQAALLLSGPLRRGSSSGGGSGAVCSTSADDAGTVGASDAALASWCVTAEPAAPGTPRGSGGAAWQSSSNSSAAAAAGAPSIRSITSLFGPELRSGVLLLELLELLAPGSVDWRTANRPPFNKRTAQLQSMENCQLALTIAMDQLGLPLVSMSPRDVVLGRRKVILSLTWQLMRFHTMQLLESLSAVKQPAPSASQPDGTPSLPQGGVNISSSSRKQRRRLAISEQDILHWANTKLQHVAGAPTLRSFKDPALASGVVLLQLLHALAPTLVDVAFINEGVTPEQRLSNARYVLAQLDALGCSVFAVPEDLVDPPQPRMVLVLLASLMSWDLQQQQQQQQQQLGSCGA